MLKTLELRENIVISISPYNSSIFFYMVSESRQDADFLMQCYVFFLAEEFAFSEILLPSTQIFFKTRIGEEKQTPLPLQIYSHESVMYPSDTIMFICLLSFCLRPKLSFQLSRGYVYVGFVKVVAFCCVPLLGESM